MLNHKIENEKSLNLFFVFVSFNGQCNPEYYIVPREVVAVYAKENHAQWLNTPGKKNNNIKIHQ